ncbi:MAG TPA: ABC transporter permease [Bryobacteraceae bacterium]|nr:ABC transporter permease [Bryobacteraceae bacterium]
MNLPGQHFLRNLVAQRTLLYQMVRRDFESRFIGSVAGWVWGLIHPLVLLASWTFVFQYCLRVPLPQHAVTQNYTMFLFCGYLPWMLFQETLSRSSTCLLEHRNLITKTVFPSEVIPISVFLSALVSHLMALTMLVVASVLWFGYVSGMIAFLPIYMLLTGLLGVGLGWIISSLQVYLRDTAQVVSVVLTLWFWTTPIFIAVEDVPQNLRFIVNYNPMSYLVRAYRDRLLSYTAPDLSELAMLTAYALSAFFIGGLFFRHLKRGFADVL